MGKYFGTDGFRGEANVKLTACLLYTSTNRNTTVKTLKTVKTATTQKYTKKSKTAVQTRKVTTTIQTTTTVMAASATAGKANAASTKKVESISLSLIHISFWQLLC